MFHPYSFKKNKIIKSVNGANYKIAIGVHLNKEVRIMKDNTG